MIFVPLVWYCTGAFDVLESLCKIPCQLRSGLHEGEGRSGLLLRRHGGHLVLSLEQPAPPCKRLIIGFGSPGGVGWGWGKGARWARGRRRER